MKSKYKFMNTDFLKEVFIFFVFVPLFLVIIYYSPLNEIFHLYTATINIITIYFSNFAHSNINHLKGNIFSYFMVFTMLFVLNKVLNIRSKREFYFDIGFIFFIVPFVVSFYNILHYPNNNTNAFLGFSGIVSALCGYLPALLLVGVYKKAQIQTLNIHMFSSVIFFNLIILTIFVYEVKTELILVLLLIMFFSILLIKKDLITMHFVLKSYFTKNVSAVLYCLIVILIILVLYFILLLWLSLFPSNIVSDSGSKTNILGHYLGYCVGIFTPLTVQTLKRIGHISKISLKNLR